jgi:hypothetical protein
VRPREPAAPQAQLQLPRRLPCGNQPVGLF